MKIKISKNVGVLYFIGIGGIGMSGIAEVLINLGYQVCGSDLVNNANVMRLGRLGAKIHLGHCAENLEDAQVVVISSAIKPDNPELIAARSRSLPVVKRAEMLAELMRFKSTIAVAGSHGKTTTTSLIATLLETNNMDPTVINGGIINSYGTNVRCGSGDWMVVEADESDGSFIKLPVDIALVTNIDPEHIDYYHSIEALKNSFLTFIENVPFYGFAVLYIDNPMVKELAGRVEDRRIISYGQSPQADYRLVDFRVTAFGSNFSVERRTDGTELTIENIDLPMIGRYNALNAIAALALADQLGMSHDIIRTALGGFKGVKRRFTYIGEIDGVRVFDDYAHHPVEVANVLQAARESLKIGRVITVFQPHRYTRLNALFDDFSRCFGAADTVMIMPVYGAGETACNGMTHAKLAAEITANGHPDARNVDDAGEVVETVAKIAHPGDIVILMGAGDITKLSNSLVSDICDYNGRGQDMAKLL